MLAHAPSLWMDQVVANPRPPLDGDVSVDVAVIGAGFTGLWTAYYLKQLSRDVRVVVLDANSVGFGASGRNGGWCMASMAASRSWSDLAGEAAGRRMNEAIGGMVDEIHGVVTAEGIECDWARGGSLELARNGGQEARLLRHVGGDLRWLDAAEARELCGATRVLGGLFDPATAAIHPAKLVTGLARACEAAGVVVHEETKATRVTQGVVETTRGTVRADAIVVATEAYTQSIAGYSRRLVPFYSLMIATEQLPRPVLEQVRLETRPTFADARYRVIYGQRTADDRLAFGSPGPSYRYASSIDTKTEQDAAWHERIHAILLDMFPVLDGMAVTHRWGGVLGVPRNWLPSIEADPASGIYRPGGYIGEGVGAANLAGRCVAHLIAETGDEVTTLPWIRRRSRRWPVEPFRWAGIRMGAKLLELADGREQRRDRPAPEAELVWKVLRR
jgi:glycine/D-amino acid oxidase-like deaminating enzyme